MLFRHALCTALVQCTEERHSVLQHSSPHAHTSLSDLNHNYKRYTQRQTAALYHHHTAWKQSQPIFSEQHCSRAKDVSHLVCHKTRLDGGLSNVFLPVWLNQHGAFSHFSRTELWTVLLDERHKRAKVQQAINDVWSLPLPNPSPYSTPLLCGLWCWAAVLLSVWKSHWAG